MPDRRKTLKIVLPLAIVVLGVIVAVILVRSKPEVETQEPETPPPLVRVIEVQPRDVQLDVVSQGTVEPRTTTTLVAQVSGRVDWIAPSFASGGLFQAGQTLVRIDPRDYRLAVEQARSQVAQAQVALAREEAEARVARAEWQELGDGEPASPLVLREPQLAQARAAVAAARAAVAQAELQLERTTVSAPYTGRVRDTQVDVGQSVSPGTPLGTVYATDYVEVPLPVPVAELEYLDLSYDREMTDGPPVLLAGDFGGRRRTWRGRIVRTEGTIDPESRMLDLIARVDQPYGQEARVAGAPLPVGLFVEATVAGETARGVYLIPRSALRETGRWRDGEPGKVLVVEGGDGQGAGGEPARLRFRDVAILRLAGDEAVVSAGLAPGDRLCVSPLETPIDGMAVRTTGADKPDLQPPPAGIPDAPRLGPLEAHPGEVGELGEVGERGSTR